MGMTANEIDRIFARKDLAFQQWKLNALLKERAINREYESDLTVKLQELEVARAERDLAKLELEP